MNPALLPRFSTATSGAAPTLAAATPAHQRIVDLDEVMQPINTVPVPHGHADFAQYPASSNPGHADLFSKTQGGNPALVRGDQVDRPEPLGQGKVGGMKQRARRKRGLVMALRAFEGMAAHLGIQPGTLSRAFNQLAEYGVKSDRSSHIFIDDTELLQTFVNNT